MRCLTIRKERYVAWIGNNLASSLSLYFSHVSFCSLSLSLSPSPSLSLSLSLDLSDLSCSWEGDTGGLCSAKLNSFLAPTIIIATCWWSPHCRGPIAWRFLTCLLTSLGTRNEGRTFKGSTDGLWPWLRMCKGDPAICRYVINQFWGYDETPAEVLGKTKHVNQMYSLRRD